MKYRSYIGALGIVEKLFTLAGGDGYENAVTSRNVVAKRTNSRFGSCGLREIL